MKRKRKKITKKKIKTFADLQKEWIRQRGEPTQKEKKLLDELLRSIKKFHSLTKVHNLTPKIMGQIRTERKKINMIGQELEHSPLFLDIVEQNSSFVSELEHVTGTDILGRFHSQMKKKISNYSLPQSQIFDEFQKIFKDTNFTKTLFTKTSAEDLKIIAKRPYLRAGLTKLFLRDPKVIPLFLDFRTKKLNKKKFSKWIKDINRERLEISEISPENILKIIDESEKKATLKEIGPSPPFPIKRALHPSFNKRTFKDKLIARDLWKKVRKITPKEKSMNILEIGPGRTGIKTIKKWKETGRKGKLTFIEKGLNYARAVSVSPQMLEEAAIKDNLKNIRIIAGDAVKRTYKRGYYDHIVMRSVINNMTEEQVEILFNNLKPALKKGGTIRIDVSGDHPIKRFFSGKNYIIKRNGYKWLIRKKEKGEK